MVDRIGNCRVVGEIGSGGMAVVYKAVQETLGRDVAIKALKPQVAMDTQFAERFEREAHFMASLQHENILHVYDFIKDGRSMYIVMEYVQGIDLYDLLEHTPVLPPDVAAIVALQVARALEYAHFRGVVHRDIKPANVMISYGGEVKLMDFGIARDDRLRDLTEAGTGLGTPSYMSPEQIVGDKVDFRSDLFSVGIVLYQMLTGKKPFTEAPERSVMQAIRLDRYVPMRKVVPSVPRALERVVASCLEKLPSQRYASTQHLIDELMEYLAGRAGGSYAGRLVSYLLEVGLITESEASAVLDPSASEITRRGGSRDKTLLRHVGLASLLGLTAAGVGGYLIQDRHGGLSFEAMLAPQTEAAPLSLSNSGQLRVVVEPWAHVYVDGEQVMTTPSALPITLSSGKHHVKLENPYFREEQREIVVKPGETLTLSVALDPLGADDAEGEAP